MLRPVFPRTPGAANTICAIRSGRALAACRPGTLLDRGPCGHLHLQRCQRCLASVESSLDATPEAVELYWQSRIRDHSPLLDSRLTPS